MVRTPLTSHRDADVEDRGLAGQRHQRGLGSLIVPSKVGRSSMVMLSPTMLVSLAGSSLKRARRDRRRRGVDDERVVEVAAGVAVARGERQLDAGVGVVVVGQVLAVEGDALRVGEHRRAAAEEDQPVGVGRERQPAGAQVDDQRVGRAVVRQLAGQADELAGRVAPVTAQLLELDRVGVDRVGVDRAR